MLPFLDVNHPWNGASPWDGTYSYCSRYGGHHRDLDCPRDDELPRTDGDGGMVTFLGRVTTLVIAPILGIALGMVIVVGMETGQRMVLVRGLVTF